MCLLTAGPKRLRLAGEACSLLAVSISSPRLTSQRSHSQAGPKPKEVPRGRQQPETSSWEEERGDESRSSLLTLISLWPRPGVKGEAGQVQGQWMGVAWWAAAASSSLTQPHLGKGPPGFSPHRVDPPPPPFPTYCDIVYSSLRLFNAVLSLSDITDTGWLGVKHQFTLSLCFYLSLSLFSTLSLSFWAGILSLFLSLCFSFWAGILSLSPENSDLHLSYS